MSRISLLILSLFLLPTTQIYAKAEVTLLDKIIVIVDNNIITQIELDERVKLISQQLTQQGTRLPSKNILQKQILERLILEKIQLDIAENGAVALEMHQQNRYDLILMDCQMPVMDGYQATEEIRANEKEGQHTPIIAVTANASDEDRQQTIDAGMDDFMSKPFNKEPLLQMISKWLNREA